MGALMPPFAKILVANRGEIAVRVIRACRELGVATVAVVSEADRHSRHAHLADEVVILGPAPALESYLRIDKLVEAARETGAEAVHPGYGFLAENAGFARACVEAGLVFIGPPAEVIDAMGDKTAARRLMAEAGVPVVPGANLPAPGPEGAIDEAAVREAAAAVGVPLLVKASLGGGGKGMRRVDDLAAVPAAAAAASREARQAFGDGAVYLERYLERPRHVEFQVFGDVHGEVVHLGERECSVQRRHQKIIEESPSPALDDALRARMGEAAVAAARAVGYVNAGTVEFLLDARGEFHFLEMNTRLQVEHPVTELVTGLDLVRAQIEVAAGLPLPWRQDEISPRGHAFECRLYAEDPAHDFRPSVGPVLLYREPAGPGVRVDSGIAEGDEVSVHYDPLLAKLSVHAADRGEAIDRARNALRDYAVLGVTTNATFLDAVLAHPAFRAGDLHTGFIPEHLPDWRPEPPDRVLALAAVGLSELARAENGGAGPDGSATGAAAGSPWSELARFRLNGLDWEEQR